MELVVAGVTNKRPKLSVEDNETTQTDSEIAKAGEEETAVATLASEQVKLEIANIHEKIERFTNLVSELLESGKPMLKDLSNEFEERIILLHKERMEKWQEEIKELRLLDISMRRLMLFCEMLNIYFRMFAMNPELFALC